ncbi:hypothetical protein KGA65_02985 [Ideonella sp. B7]|uniref:hypothetical protein n=1 Tax=Ideonella benzenivorans TaxID=2831643 RepID=UPI001CECE12A|nr:hypothetical protein [Ideonella benzenivorans]MCA6215501.1 hypothetical protein [Ideonella benzenivorans]
MRKDQALRRRSLLGAALLAIGWPALAAGTPTVNLRIELRWRQEPGPAVAPGTVIVRSDGRRVDSHGPGQVWRSAPAPADPLSPEGTLPVVTVRNGTQARVALTRWRPVTSTEWRWRTDSGTTATSAAQASGQAELRGRSDWQPDTAQLTLQPRWAGGQQPVNLFYGLRLPQALDGDVAEAPPRVLEGEGELLLPLGRWTPLGQWAASPPVGRHGDVVTSTRDVGGAGTAELRWLEVRITRP